MHKVTIKKVIDSNDVNKLKDIAYETIKILDCLEEKDEELYAKFELDIYEIINGKKISEDIALQWVENMQPKGMYYSIDETNNVLRQKNWNLDSIDFFVVANMIKNDYYDTISDDELIYQVAKDWLLDKDVKEHKLYNYYKYIV